MVRTRRNFSREFKLQIVKELEGSKTLVQIVREHEIDQSVVARWYREYRKYGGNAFLVSSFFKIGQICNFLCE